MNNTEYSKLPEDGSADTSTANTHTQFNAESVRLNP
jgi:hypothetical protein